MTPKPPFPASGGTYKDNKNKQKHKTHTRGGERERPVQTTTQNTRYKKKKRREPKRHLDFLEVLVLHERDRVHVELLLQKVGQKVYVPHRGQQLLHATERRGGRRRRAPTTRYRFPSIRLGAVADANRRRGNKTRR